MCLSAAHPSDVCASSATLACGRLRFNLPPQQCNGTITITAQGVQAAPAGSALLYDMGTYTSSTLSFESELIAAVESIKLGHLTVGLSASTDSWKTGAPTSAELDARFKSLAAAMVSRLALFGTQFLPVYGNDL